MGGNFAPKQCFLAPVSFASLADAGCAASQNTLAASQTLRRLSGDWRSLGEVGGHRPGLCKEHLIGRYALASAGQALQPSTIDSGRRELDGSDWIVSGPVGLTCGADVLESIAPTADRFGNPIAHRRRLTIELKADDAIGRNGRRHAPHPEGVIGDVSWELDTLAFVLRRCRLQRKGEGQ